MARNTADVAFITPEVLTWALDRSPLTRDVVAKKLHVSVDVLRSWERHPEAHPPFQKAERIAELLHIPFGALFLPKPLDVGLPIPDRRSMRKGYRPSLDFQELLSDILVKQDWYREHVSATANRPKLPFVGGFTPSDLVQDVAANIRSVLGITPELRNSVGSWSEYMSTLARQAEDAGVLVMRSSVVGNSTSRRVDIKEVQGFALVDPIAPVVFVNSADYKASQIFTFAHEIAHIWVGQSAIDKPDPTELHHTNNLENFVNRVAAAVLIPQTEFVPAWKTESRDRRVNSLARRFWVSTLVVIRRARETGQITDEEFQELKRQELAKIETKKAPGGGDFYRNLVVRMGGKLTYTVLGEVNRDRIPLLDASRLLGVKVKTLVTFAEMAK